MDTHRLLTVFLSLRAIMLIGSAGAMLGALLMFLQGGFYLHEAWHTIMTVGDAAQRQVTVPVLEAVDSFLFGIVLVIFAYGIAIGFVFTLPEGYGGRLPVWMKVGGVGQLKATLAEVVIVVLIVIFARIVVEANGHLQWSMLVLPASILLIAVALRMIELGSKEGAKEEDAAH
ncbi:YqhA family protein [Methyloceanibacter sp.]|uniref:YqhA family protein n=1 Tax=Methyloceanibacter sp. TaxID=1965321 RepID=UPI003D6D9C98